MTRQPQPGDFGLSITKGWAGILITLGQTLCGDASRYTHAFLVLDDGSIVEAEPGGAEINPIERYDDRKTIYSHLALTDEQRKEIVEIGRTLKGTPYSFLDYLAIAVARLGFKPQWLRRYIADSGHMICSQLVDEVYRRAGINLFEDHRLPQEVTPGDLLYVIVDSEG